MTRVEFVMRPLDWVLLGVLSLLWGSSFFWTTIALQSVPPAWIVTTRLVLAALFMLSYLKVTRTPLPKRLDDWRALAILGLLSNLIPFTAYTLSQVYISSAMAAVLNAFTPLSVLVLSQIFRLEDRMTWYNTTGALLGISGVAVLMLPSLQGQGWGQAIGVAFALLAALFYAIGSLFARRHQRIEPSVMATGMLSFAALYSLPIALISTVGLPQLPGMGTVGALVALGLLSTALAYLLFFNLLKRVGSANASTVALLLPVTALLLGVLVLHERFTMLNLGAMVLVFLGLVFIDGRMPRALVSRGRRPKTRGQV